MKSITINIKDDTTIEYVNGRLNHFKDDGVEIIVEEDLDDLTALRTTKGKKNLFLLMSIVIMQTEKQPFHWRSAISYKTKDEIVVRGYDLNALTGNVDFSSMVQLVLKGELPPENHRKMIDAILVNFCEHAFSPSSASCRFVASGGVPLNTAVAGGILTMGERHASADVPARMFQDAVKIMKEQNLSAVEMAEQMVGEYRAQKKILNGYHHPQHIKDPRVERLIELAREYGIEGPHQALALAIQKETGRVYSRTLYLNAPGIMAAILSDMDFTPGQIKGLAILSRTVSMVAHSLEEQEREKAWRGSGQSDITQPLDLSLQDPAYYDGPEKRSI